MLDNRNHVKISVKDKFRELMKPVNFVKLVLVQQHELERMAVNKVDKPAQTFFIEFLYKHYIVEGKTKAELCN